MKLSSTLGFLLPLKFTIVTAHTRLECPPPRSAETGEKVGPCDGPDDLSLPAYPLIPGALNTITWLESISHPGAPARFALSLDGDDSVESFESCLLLDHVPHDELSLPNIGDQLTWHRSSITLWIPDVYCERCHLQLMTVMSDNFHGVPANTSCAYGGALATGRTTDPDLPACPVVYHSCSPVSINGTVPRNDPSIAQCNTSQFEQELGWPQTPRQNPNLYDYSTYYYKGDPGMFNQSHSTLMGAGAPIVGCDNVAHCIPEIFFQETMTVADDAPYTRMEGTCAAMVTKEVIEFQLGVLPTEDKNMSDIQPPPNAAQAACAACIAVEPCFFEACPLRDMTTGNWTGPAEGCSLGVACSVCFPASPCLMKVDDTMTEDDTSEPVTDGASGAVTDDDTSSGSLPDEPMMEDASGAMAFGRRLAGIASIGLLALF